MTAVNLNRAVRGPVTAVPVVAGKGVRLVADTVNNRFVVEADETVLWSNSAGATSCTLSENYTNFEYIDVYYKDSDQKVMMKRIVTDQTVHTFNVSSEEVSDNFWIKTSSFSINGTAIARTGNCQIRITSASAVSYSTANNYILLYKIVGINRIAGGN